MYPTQFENQNIHVNNQYWRHWLKERAEAVEEERRARESLLLSKEEQERLQMWYQKMAKFGPIWGKKFGLSWIREFSFAKASAVIRIPQNISIWGSMSALSDSERRVFFFGQRKAEDRFQMWLLHSHKYRSNNEQVLSMKYLSLTSKGGGG